MELFTNDLKGLIADCAADAQEVIIVSPYIKLRAAKWLLSLLPPYAQILVLTRANPVDCVLRATDIEALELLYQKGANIYLDNSLHAKYFRFDSTVLIGSANLTNRGVYLLEAHNTELLVRVELTPEILDVEASLFDVPTRDTRSVLDDLRQAIEAISADPKQMAAADMLRQTSRPFDLVLSRPGAMDGWPFRSTDPSALWLCYHGQGIGRFLSKRKLQDAMHDIELLDLPFGIESNELFNKVIGESLEALPIIGRLDKTFDKNSRPDRPYLSYRTLAEKLGISREQCLEGKMSPVNVFIRWVTYFLPTRFYETKPQQKSQLLGRFKKLSNEFD